MQLVSTQLPPDHNIFLFGDLHDGTITSFRRGWLNLVDMMHSKYDGCKNNYGVDHGDMIEAITVNDKRFNLETTSEPLPLLQAREAVMLRRRISKQLITILQGNHELALQNFGDIASDIAFQLEVPYGTYSCKVIVKDKKNNPVYKMFCTHGRKSINSTADDPIRRRANMELQLKRHLKFNFGDCSVMTKGHTHRLLVCKPTSELYLTDDGKEIHKDYTTGVQQGGGYIHPDARWYGNTGSFTRLFTLGASSYAERAEYDPMELGFLILKVRDYQIIDLVPYYL